MGPPGGRTDAGSPACRPPQTNEKLLLLQGLWLCFQNGAPDGVRTAHLAGWKQTVPFCCQAQDYVTRISRKKGSRSSSKTLHWFGFGCPGLSLEVPSIASVPPHFPLLSIHRDETLLCPKHLR